VIWGLETENPFLIETRAVKLQAHNHRKTGGTMLKILYCHWCRGYTSHNIGKDGEATCYKCVRRAMEEEAKYLDNLRTAQGKDFDEEC
jgi:hypothetical protein